MVLFRFYTMFIHVVSTWVVECRPVRELGDAAGESSAMGWEKVTKKTSSRLFLRHKPT